jgi:hypothetical protein
MDRYLVTTRRSRRRPADPIGYVRRRLWSFVVAAIAVASVIVVNLLQDVGVPLATAVVAGAVLFVAAATGATLLEGRRDAPPV